MSSTDEIHNFIEKHGLIKYNQMVQNEKERVNRISNNKPPLSHDVEKKVIKKKKRKKQKAHLKHDVFGNANVLLKPEFDASERETLARNNFMTKNNKMKLMLAAEKMMNFDEFVPQYMGEMGEQLDPVYIKKKAQQAPNQSPDRDTQSRASNDFENAEKRPPKIPQPAPKSPVKVDKSHKRNFAQHLSANSVRNQSLSVKLGQSADGKIGDGQGKHLGVGGHGDGRSLGVNSVKNGTLQKRLKNVIGLHKKTQSAQGHTAFQAHFNKSRKDYENFLHSQKLAQEQTEDEEEFTHPYTQQKFSIDKLSSLQNPKLQTSLPQSFSDRMFKQSQEIENKPPGLSAFLRHKARVKSVSTLNDRHTAFNSLNPLLKTKHEEDKPRPQNSQSNIKNRLEQMVTEENAEIVDQYIDQDYYTLLEDKKLAKAKKKQVFFCTKFKEGKAEEGNPVVVKDEEESGQEYFEFEEDPMKDAREDIQQFSENYYLDRHHAYKKTRDFLPRTLEPKTHHTQKSADLVRQASFESSSLSQKSEDLFTEKDLIDLPKLSHTGTKVRIHRDKVSVHQLEVIKREEEMNKHFRKIRQDIYNNDNDKRVAKKFTVLKKDSTGKFTKLAQRRAKIKNIIKVNREKAEEEELERRRKLYLESKRKPDEIEVAMKKQKAEREKRAKLEAYKRSKMLRVQKLTITQLRKLQKHTDHKTYASKKRMWMGENGKFKDRDIKEYYKKFDANQIFLQKNMQDYKVVKERNSDDED